MSHCHAIEEAVLISIGRDVRDVIDVRDARDARDENLLQPFRMVRTDTLKYFHFQ